MAPTGETRKFPNGKAGFKSLLTWLKGRPVSKVVYEPTGCWHRNFEQALIEAGLALAQVNPLQARRFAQARGRRAKTDSIDAGMLAQMGMAFDLRQTTLLSPRQRQLKELQPARWSRVQERTAVENRLPQLHTQLLKRQARNRLRQIKRERAALETEIAGLIQADAKLARINRILTSIPGISRTTSATLLAELPEIGTLESREVASLAGVAPMTRQSGTWKGKSFTQGRTRTVAERALHGRLGGDTIQPGPPCQIPATPEGRETGESRSDGDHKETDHPSQYARQTGPNLVGDRPSHATLNILPRDSLDNMDTHVPLDNASLVSRPVYGLYLD